MVYIKYKNKYSKGMGLLEIVIGTSIISISMIGLIFTFNFFIRAGFENTEKIQAIYLLEEGIEVFRFMRDNSWSANTASLSKDIPYYLVLVGLEWQATTTISFIDNIFDRTILISDVHRRDSDSDIIASTTPDSKTIDTNTVKITTKVVWDDKEIEAITYLTNIFNN